MTSFDAFSQDYAEINDRMLAGTGESTEALAAGKAKYLAGLLSAEFEGKILDYGCGVGLVTRALRQRFSRATVHGYDPSARSIAAARQNDEGESASGSAASGTIRYADALDALDRDYDLILLANVLHHVPPSERPELVAQLATRLSDPGRFAILEHNPRNWPVMRILARHPFDQDAVFVRHEEAEALLSSVNLDPRTDFIVFFPGPLRPLQFLERCLRRIPFGAQYVCSGVASQ